MTISSYTELLAEVADWLDRDDLTLKIPKFVRLAESDFASKLNRHFRAVDRAITTITADEEFFGVPQDLRLIKFMYLIEDGRKYSLGLLNDSQSTREFDLNYRDIPAHYSIIGNEIRLSPIPIRDFELQIIYYRSVTPLNDSQQQSNWVLEYYPNIYLFGSLAMAANFTGDDQRSAYYASMYQQAVDIAIQEGREQETSLGPLTIFPDFETY